MVGVWERGRFEPARSETVIRDHTVLVMAGSKDHFSRYDELFCIYSGTVEVVRNGSGADRVVATMKRGNFVGEMSVIGKVRRTATMRARGNVELLVVHGDHFRKVLSETPQMALTLLETLVQRLVE